MSPMTGMVKRTNPPARSRSGACREAFRAGQVSFPFPPAHPSLGSALSGRPHLCARRMMMRDAGEPLVWRRVGPCATCVAQVTSCARFVRGDEGWRMMQARCGLSNSSLPGLATLSLEGPQLSCGPSLFDPLRPSVAQKRRYWVDGRHEPRAVARSCR